MLSDYDKAHYKYYTELKNEVLDKGTILIGLDPTCYSGPILRQIDHFYTNKPQHIKTTQICASFSDHELTSVELYINIPKNQPTYSIGRDYSNLDATILN